MRPERAIKFSYKIYRGIPCPIINLTVCGIEMEAYADSGAFSSIFSLQEADLLGIDYSKGKAGSAVTGDGNIIPVYSHILPVHFGPLAFNATIGFSPKLGIGINLLGRKDFFERFTVVFDDAKKTVTFIPRRYK